MTSDCSHARIVPYKHFKVAPKMHQLAGASEEKPTILHLKPGKLLPHPRALAGPLRRSVNEREATDRLNIGISIMDICHVRITRG